MNPTFNVKVSGMARPPIAPTSLRVGGGICNLQSRNSQFAIRKGRVGDPASSIGGVGGKCYHPAMPAEDRF